MKKNSYDADFWQELIAAFIIIVRAIERHKLPQKKESSIRTQKERYESRTE